MTVITGERVLTAKGVATRARIVGEAARLVFANGVAGTTLEEVRDAAGVSNSQLYHYFSDKGALVRAVVRFQTDAILDVGGDAGRLDSFAELRGWRDDVVAHQRRTGGVGGCPLGSLVGELADADEGAREELADGFRRWVDAIAAGLRTMRANGVLRPDADPDALAVVVLTALQGGLLLTQAGHDAEPLGVALDGAIGYVRTFAA